jgi:hypothetical protein
LWKWTLLKRNFFNWKVYLNWWPVLRVNPKLIFFKYPKLYFYRSARYITTSLRAHDTGALRDVHVNVILYVFCKIQTEQSIVINFVQQEQLLRSGTFNFCGFESQKKWSETLHKHWSSTACGAVLLYLMRTWHVFDNNNYYYYLLLNLIIKSASFLLDWLSYINHVLEWYLETNF